MLDYFIENRDMFLFVYLFSGFVAVILLGFVNLILECWDRDNEGILMFEGDPPLVGLIAWFPFLLPLAIVYGVAYSTIWIVVNAIKLIYRIFRKEK